MITLSILSGPVTEQTQPGVGALSLAPPHGHSMSVLCVAEKTKDSTSDIAYSKCQI